MRWEDTAYHSVTPTVPDRHHSSLHARLVIASRQHDSVSPLYYPILLITTLPHLMLSVQMSNR